MPTGYTVPIEKGCTFKEFLLHCMKIQTRYEDNGWEFLQKRELDDYHKGKLKETEKLLSDSKTLSDREVQILIDDEHTKDNLIQHEYRQRTHKLRDKYLAFRSLLRKWEPKIQSLYEFRSLLLQQIDESLRFDCPVSMGDDEERPVKTVGQKRIEMIKSANYLLQEHQKELERIESYNQFIESFKREFESLPDEINSEHQDETETQRDANSDQIQTEPTLPEVETGRCG